MPREFTRHRRYAHRRIFVINDQTTLRLVPSLAKEIGLWESLVLLQLEFLISISDHEHEGRRWTYQSVSDLHESSFHFTSRATVGRALKSLEEQGLVIRGNFNRAAFDRTSWWALDEEGISKLQSLRIDDSPR